MISMLLHNAYDSIHLFFAFKVVHESISMPFLLRLRLKEKRQEFGIFVLFLMNELS